jgi:hypothetical protein
LVSPENPLTARVAVNRFWQQFFGTGLVKTANDFGSQGTPPTHPELLDWLAVTFRESGWDVKAVCPNPARHLPHLPPEHSIHSTAAGGRPDNQCWHAAHGSGSMPRWCAISPLHLWLLSPKIGGKGVRPYQPENIWEPVAFGGSNTKNYIQDHGESLYRRSLYTFWKRTAPPPNMTSFDAPNRELLPPTRAQQHPTPGPYPDERCAVL